MVPFIGQIASNGLLGLILALVLWAYWKKDKELTENAKAHTAQAIELQREVIGAVNKLASLMEFIEKREAELREAEERARNEALKAQRQGTGPYRGSSR